MVGPAVATTPPPVRGEPPSPDALAARPPSAVTAPAPRRARWLPTSRLVWAAALPALLALGALVAPQVTTAVLVADAVLLALGVADWLRTPRNAVAIEREVPEVLAVGRPNPVTLHLKNRSSRGLTVQIAQDLFEGAESDELPLRVELKPHASVKVRYTVRPTKRGSHTLGDHVVRYTSRAGLVTRQERLHAANAIHVFPDVLALRQYDAWARKGQERMAGSARMRGGESEFERLRQYNPDDEYRHLDWKATARRRALTVRQFQTETQQSVFVMIDTGRAMRAEAEGLAFLDHALNATLMLAHVALTRGDQVGLLAFDQSPREYVPPAGGGATERKLIRALYDVEPRLAEPDYTGAFAFVKARVRRRSLVVLFTQVLDAQAATRVAALLRGLMPRHLPLCVLLRDRDVDALATDPVRDPRELYVRGAAAEAILWRQQLIRDMTAAGVLVIDAYPDQMTPQVVKRYVEIKARQLL